MHPVSQIIERNLPGMSSGGKALWINPQNDDCWQIVAGSCNSLRLSSHDHGVFRYLQGAGADARFEAWPEPGHARYGWVILGLPRQKALLAMLLDCAAALLARDGVLWLAGENQAGIKSAGRHLESRFGEVRKLDSARHCTLFQAGCTNGEPVFDPDSYRQEWPLACGNAGITVVSYPGVFAHGRLDAGTELLLAALQDMPVGGRVLDFACGAGVVGACVARRFEDAQVTLLDTSALALLASRATMEANGLSGELLASDGLAEVEDAYDWIISNPPVHAGVKTDTGLSMRLLGSVHDHVNSHGRLVIVANIHLPYERWLTQRFRRVRMAAEDGKFKVLIAEK